MEFALLEFLMRHQDQIFNASTLLERVWTADSDKSPETIRTTIKKLRNKIDIRRRAIFDSECAWRWDTSCQSCSLSWSTADITANFS
jgi:Fe2+ or Zn2+ uptake regulation protein